jgi:hypothetical protein
MGTEWLDLASADHARDREQLLALILKRLTVGDASPAEQKFIARLLAAEGGTVHELTLAARSRGNPENEQTRASNERILLEIYRRCDPKKFVARAAKETGLSEKTVRKYKKIFDANAEAAVAFSKSEGNSDN